MIRYLAFLMLLPVGLLGHAALGQSKASREALAPLGGLVGVWNGTGIPSGNREQQREGFWTEILACEWQFKGGDAWLKLDFKNGKHFTAGEIRYLPGSEPIQVSLMTTDKQTLIFSGTLKDKVLSVQSHDPLAKEDQKLVLTLLHENRILYRYEVKPRDRGIFHKKYQVGAGKEGVPFAAGTGRPECIVSGGLGTSAVSYMGKTYYVCCGGCRDEFRDNPKKYVDEYEASLKKK